MYVQHDVYYKANQSEVIFHDISMWALTLLLRSVTTRIKYVPLFPVMLNASIGVSTTPFADGILTLIN